MANLDSFFISEHRSAPLKPLATSQEIRDRSSLFVANIYTARSEQEAKKVASYVKNIINSQKRASHDMYAWRCMVLKPGHTGLEGEDDFEIHGGSEDDGEKWAGSKILRIMTEEGIIDAVVVVSRWYGGVMLGPVRFTHIETCSREVCHAFKVRDEIEESITMLLSLDAILAALRDELNGLVKQPNNDATSPTAQSLYARQPKTPDYQELLVTMDIKRARRLINARENSIKTVKASIARARAEDIEGGKPNNNH